MSVSQDWRKCPQASCYTLFGGEPNECSTSNLCPEGQFCCNDGCKNVCQWTRESAAMIAQEEARAKKQQQLIVQRQQDEMRRRQQEMYIQRQRQLATAKRARQQAEARAAAEAELSAQQARAKYEAGLRSVAAAQSKATSALQQRMAQLQTQQQRLIQMPTPPPQSYPTAGSFLDNFVGEPQSLNSINNANSNLDQQTLQFQELQLQQQQPQKTTQPVLNEIKGYVRGSKRDNVAGSLINQINSPANANPYSLLAQQNANGKDGQNELLSLIQSAPPTSARQYPTRNNQVLQRYPAEAASAVDTARDLTNVNPVQQSPSLYQSRIASPSYLVRSPSSAYPTNRGVQFYPAQKQYHNQPQRDYAYQSVVQSSYNQQASQSQVEPILMYHAMQTAA